MTRRVLDGLGLLLCVAWLAWLAAGWVWALGWSGPQSGWLTGSGHLQLEPWRVYDLYRAMLGYATAGWLLAWGIQASLAVPRPGRRASLWLRVPLALLVAGGVIGTLEWSLRVYEDTFRPLDMLMMVPDPDLVWRIAPLSTRDVNDQGLRNPHLDPPVTDELRVLCVGDSCTFGVGVDGVDAYPARLETWLRQRMPQRRVTVINAGVPGYSSLQGLASLRRDGLALHPGVVVWSFAHNDANYATLEDHEVLAPRAAPLNGLAAFLDRSHLYRYLHHELLHLRHPVEDPQGTRVAAPAGRQAMREAAALAKAAGARFVVLLLPDAMLDDPEHRAIAPGPLEIRKQAYREAIQEEAVTLGLPVVDPRGDFSKSGMTSCFVPNDTIHPNVLGCELIAHRVGPAVLRLLGVTAAAVPSGAPDLVANASLGSLPHFELFWALLRMSTEDGAPRLDAQQGGALLSILRQGPAQMDLQAAERVRAAVDRVLTAAQKQRLAAWRAGTAPFPRVLPETVPDGQSRGPGAWLPLDALLDGLLQGTLWLQAPVEPLLGGLPKGSPPPLAPTLCGLLALRAEKALTMAQDRALLPALVSLVEAADGAASHRQAIVELLTPRQAAWITRRLQAARWPPTVGLGDVPFATVCELLVRLARDYRLPSGESAMEDGTARTPVAVPYPDLIWGLQQLDRSGPNAIGVEQSRAIADVMQALLAWTQRSEPVYQAVEAGLVVILRPEQLRFVQGAGDAPVQVAAGLRGQTPAGADIIGFGLLTRLRHRAGLNPFALAPPAGVARAPGAPPPDPGRRFAALLLMEKDPALRLDAAQARRLLPYVRAASRANDVNHLVKERIGETLTEAQRRFIMAALEKRGAAGPLVSPGEVIAALRVHARSTP